MHFQELEKYKNQSPKFDMLIPQLDNYFGFYLSEVHEDNWQHELKKISIVPSNMANQLNISEALALALLAFADDEKLVIPIYEVYCSKSDNYMAEYPSKDLIPEYVHCSYHDKKHNREKFYVRLVFHFTSQAWSNFGCFYHKI